MLAITETQYNDLCREHISFLLLKGDGEKAVQFVRELLETERAAASQQAGADATIARLDSAICVLADMQLALQTRSFKS